MSPHKETIKLFVPEDSIFGRESAILGFTRAQVAAAALSKYGYPAKEVDGTEFQCIISQIDVRFWETVEKMGLVRKQEGKEA